MIAGTYCDKIRIFKFESGTFSEVQVLDPNGTDRRCQPSITGDGRYIAVNTKRDDTGANKVAIYSYNTTS